MTSANEKLKEIEKLIKINKKCCPDCRSYNEFLKEEKKSILLGLESARKIINIDVHNSLSMWYLINGLPKNALQFNKMQGFVNEELKKKLKSE